jgi:RNA polymerase sigma-70 factor (ECF subfamily)
MPDRERQEEFAELVGRHQGPLFGYLYALVQNRSDAEELQHQTILTAWRKFDEFETGTAFLRWCLRIAQHEALHFLRSRRRSRVVFNDDLVESMLDSYADRPERMVVEARQDALLACLDKLSPGDRELVDRCYRDDTTVEKVAAEIERPSRSVFNSLRRIRQRLLECIDRTLAGGERS